MAGVTTPANGGVPRLLVCYLVCDDGPEHLSHLMRAGLGGSFNTSFSSGYREGNTPRRARGFGPVTQSIQQSNKRGSSMRERGLRNMDSCCCSCHCLALRPTTMVRNETPVSGGSVRFPSIVHGTEGDRCHRNHLHALRPRCAVGDLSGW